jgi:multidrug efflux system membrane fusion protein
MSKTSPGWSEEGTAKSQLQARRTRAMFGQWWFWLLLLSLASAGGFLYFTTTTGMQPHAASPFGRDGPRSADAARVMPVAVARTRIGDIKVYLDGLGTAVALNTVTVKSRVDGQLTRVLFREGQIVKRGELLAEIDPRPFQVQLMQAEGQLARDTALLANARLDLERYRILYEQDSIARQQLDTQAALVRQYEGAVLADRGQIEDARLQLTYARITAPIAGRIGLRQVDEGNIVHASDTTGLVVITQLQPVSVLFTMPEDSIPKVMQQLQAGNKLEVDAYDRAQRNKLASGYLVTLDNQIDPTTGTVKLKAQFANERFSLFPNQFVNTRLLVEVRRDVVIAPSAALQLGNQGAFVYVVKEDQSVVLRPVRTGATQGDETEIVSGLAPGELVVVDGADKLREGAKVKVSIPGGAVDPAPGSAGAPPRQSDVPRGGKTSSRSGA